MPPDTPFAATVARRLLAWLLLCSSILSLLATPASAAVQLLYFQGSTESDRILLEWETATELDNVGFQVLRSPNGGSIPGNYTPVPVIDAISGTPFNTFIPARGDSLLGAYYPLYDENVQVGSRYFYYLQDVDTSNFSSYHGPIEVVAGQTFTPTPSPTGSNPTRTSTPSRTPPGPTATPVPRSPTPTTTPVPSVTPNGSPTTTSTLAPNVTPLDATLTAIALALTDLPTATRTPVPLAQAASPTPQELSLVVTLPATPTMEPGLLAGAGEGDYGRLVLAIVLFLASGALLTGGILFLARRSREEP